MSISMTAEAGDTRRHGQPEPPNGGEDACIAVEEGSAQPLDPLLRGPFQPSLHPDGLVL